MEENPGPTISDIIHPTTTVSADSSQGNEAIFGVNAGKQCVAMSHTTMIYHQIQDISLWTNRPLALRGHVTNAPLNPFTTTRRFSGSRKKCLKHYAPQFRRKNHGRQRGIIPRQIPFEGGLPITIGFPDKFPKLLASKNMVVSPKILSYREFLERYASPFLNVFE